MWPSLAVNVFILEAILTNYVWFSEQRVLQIVWLLQVCAPNMIIHLKVVFFLCDFTATVLTLLLYDSTKDFIISLRLTPGSVRTVHSKLQDFRYADQY